MIFVVLAIAVACVAADVTYTKPEDYKFVPIVKSSYEISPEGNTFNYGYETGSGIFAQAEGVVKKAVGSEEPALEVRGSYSYVSPDGTPVQTTYVANEQGFVAEGSHIPVAPPVPEAILRSLAYIEANKPYVETTNVYKKN